jgi:hypothetical protein
MKMETPIKICPDCKVEMPFGEDIHRSVWHQGRIAVKCGLCERVTSDFPGHYLLYHESDMPLKAGPNYGLKLIQCPVCCLNGNANMNTTAIEYHLRLQHKIEDCGCGTAMTHSDFHKCKAGSGSSRSYCFMCPGWIASVTRREYYDHMESHMKTISTGLRGCSICNCYFDSRDGIGFQTHSCGEMRRNKKGEGDVVCGKCSMSVKNLPELKEHYDRFHYRKEPLSQVELDFEAAKRDMTKFPCEKCMTVFIDGHDWDKHNCNEEAMRKKAKALDFLSDTAAVLSKVGRPDPEKGKDAMLIRCAACGNRFTEHVRYESHACKVKHHDKYRISLLVSPEREDKSHMHFAFNEYGDKTSGDIVYVRGIPTEDYLTKLFRESGATVVQISGSTPDQRDKIMVQQADLVLAFPGKSSQKKEIVRTSMTVMGVKVQTVVFPDQIMAVPPAEPENDQKSTEDASKSI